MAKVISNVLQWFGRLVKALISVVLIPPIIGLALAMADRLTLVSVGARSFTEWMVRGGATYLGVHLLFYHPTTLFRLQHGLLSRVAVWLFGGQVATTGAKGEKSSKKSSKGKSEGSAAGSTLLVVSPYLVPLYAILLCVVAWSLKHWWAPAFLDAVVAFLLGVSLAFHWVMTADDLQQHRDQFPFDTYLLTLAIIGLASLAVVSVCIPLVAPDCSIPALFGDALARTGGIYTSITHTLFF